MSEPDQPATVAVDRAVRPVAGAKKTMDIVMCLRSYANGSTTDRTSVAMAQEAATEIELLRAVSGRMLEEFARRIEAAERERCAQIVDVAPKVEAWEIHGGQETIDVLRDLAARIRDA